MIRFKVPAAIYDQRLENGTWSEVYRKWFVPFREAVYETIDRRLLSLAAESREAKGRVDSDEARTLSILFSLRALLYTKEYRDARDRAELILGPVMLDRGEKMNASNAKQFRRQMAAAMSIAPEDSPLFFSSQGITRENVKTLPGLFRVKGKNFFSPHVEEMAERSVTFFKDLEEEKIADIGRIVQSGFEEGKLGADIAKQLRHEVGVTQSRSELIARDQMGKLHGRLTQARQQAVGVGNYVWRSAGDGKRVRLKHRQLNGKIRSWDEPHHTEGHPGFPVRCRCVAEPIIPGLPRV